VEGAFHVGLIDGGLQDRVSSVEVAVREVVSDRAICRHGMAGCVASTSSGRALAASPISSSRIRAASNTGRFGKVAVLQMGADHLNRDLISASR
jgi:predicted NBD/HSP70 family sugar kinase